MEFVGISIYAEGYYSGETYEETLLLKKESYEKIKEVIPEEISCGELDGKHSEVLRDVCVENIVVDSKVNDEQIHFDNDGDFLESEISDLYEEHGLNLEEEQKEIEEYLDTLDIFYLDKCFSSEKSYK